MQREGLTWLEANELAQVWANETENVVIIYRQDIVIDGIYGIVMADEAEDWQHRASGDCKWPEYAPPVGELAKEKDYETPFPTC